MRPDLVAKGEDPQLEAGVKIPSRAVGKDAPKEGSNQDPSGWQERQDQSLVDEFEQAPDGRSAIGSFFVDAGRHQHTRAACSFGEHDVSINAISDDDGLTRVDSSASAKFAGACRGSVFQ